MSGVLGLPAEGRHRRLQEAGRHADEAASRQAVIEVEALVLDDGDEAWLAPPAPAVLLHLNIFP